MICKKTVDYYSKDLTVFRRRSRAYPLAFKDQAGDPKDITGWLVTLTVKHNRDDPDIDAVLIKDAIPSIPEEGKTSITLSVEDLDIVAKDYYYDISVLVPGGLSLVMMLGRYKVLDPVREIIP